MTRLTGARIRAAGAAVALVAVLAGLLVLRASTDQEPMRVTAEFESAVGLYAGSDVRVLGVKVGKVTGVHPDGDLVRVELEIDAEVAVAASTHAVIVAPTLVSDRYVQLSEPWTDGPRLEAGTTIPTARTAVPVEVDQLYESLDQVVSLLGPEGANRDGALSELISVGSENLGGNGRRIRQVLADLGAATGTLSDSGADTFAIVDNLDRFARVLLANDGHVADVDRQLARVTRTLATDRRVMQDGLRHLAVAVGLVERFIEDNRGHIDTSVRELGATVDLLVQRERSLAQMLAVAPVTVQNVLRSYDAGRRLLVGRGNPNDVTLWDPGTARLPLPLSPPREEGAG
ncbi:MCE family protein [Nocardioides antri]|uniref:MCE family protein n=1 Tax=Nocardioides antri TaxID=2607659 RepID=A0A5B1M084_9ACTN|nr:MCE family protein [Nocardioides antri]KAA1426141.1 MCE family protein [Nocardioides antri]